MRKRNPKRIVKPIEFLAEKDHVVGVIAFDEDHTLGLRFESPEHILQFVTKLMDKAVLVWPDNEWIKEYLSD